MTTIRYLRTKNKRNGFTLIEILVVIAIVGVLGSVVLVAANQVRQQAKIVKARVMVREIRKAISLLEADTMQWPGHKTIDDVEAGASGNEIWDLNAPEAGLVQTDGNFLGWRGPYIQIVPPDPWGHNYFFDTDYDVDPGPGQKWATVVGSFGPNGVGQNIYDSDDIYETIVSE